MKIKHLILIACIAAAFAGCETTNNSAANFLIGTWTSPTTVTTGTEHGGIKTEEHSDWVLNFTSDTEMNRRIIHTYYRDGVLQQISKDTTIYYTYTCNRPTLIAIDKATSQIWDCVVASDTQLKFGSRTFTKVADK